MVLAETNACACHVPLRRGLPRRPVTSPIDLRPQSFFAARWGHAGCAIMAKRSCEAAAAGDDNVHRQLKRRGKERKLVVGTDFSGLDTPFLAFKQMGVAVRHAFSCDSARTCQRIISHCMAPEHLFKDITECPAESKPGCDVYFTGFPCTSQPPLSMRLGIVQR